MLYAGKEKVGFRNMIFRLFFIFFFGIIILCNLAENLNEGILKN